MLWTRVKMALYVGIFEAACRELKGVALRNGVIPGGGASELVDPGYRNVAAGDEMSVQIRRKSRRVSAVTEFGR